MKKYCKNSTVREYCCKHSWSTEKIITILTSAYCPITRASNNSHFHSSHFFALYFPSQYQWFFLSLLPFLNLEIKNNCVQSHYTTRTAPSVVPFCGIRTWLGDQKRIPRVVITSFFSFPFESDIKDCRTPQLCVKSLLLFLNYLFPISPRPYSRAYLQYRTIVQINTDS